MRGMTEVTTETEASGQLVTLGGQLKTVTSLVVKTVETETAGK